MRYVKAELHTHTVHSDGSMLPQTLAAAAAERGYEIIVCTDHNTVSALPHLKKAAEGLPLKIIDGIEWTTFFGHLVITGGKNSVNWREVDLNNIDLKLAEVIASGDAVTLAHPTRIGGHICCGCHNDYDIKRWENVSAIEVWSLHYPNQNLPNKEAKKLWLSLLDKGYRIAAVYGYDWHNRDADCPPYAATYLGIEGNAGNDSVVKAIRAGRTYVSEGVMLDVEVTREGMRYEIGDIISQGRVRIRAAAKAEADFNKRYKVEITGLRIAGSAAAFEAAGDTLDCEVELNQGHFRIEVAGSVEGAAGDLAFTSPYYVLSKEEKL